MSEIEYLDIYDYQPIYEFRLYAGNPGRWFNINTPEKRDYVNSLSSSARYLSIIFEEVSHHQYKITNLGDELFPDKNLYIEKYKEAIADNTAGGIEKAKKIIHDLQAMIHHKMMILDLFNNHLRNAKKTSTYMRINTLGVQSEIDYKAIDWIYGLLLKAIDDYVMNYRNLLDHLEFSI